MATTRAVLRDSATMIRRVGQRVRTAAAPTAAHLHRLQRRLRALRPIVQRVLDQTRAGVLGGDIYVADKVASIFEPHTAVIRKGKKAKPTEFGNLITIQEAEQQIVAAYAIHDGRPADRTLWVEALERHQQIFGHAPFLATADRGFFPRRMNRRQPPAACAGSRCRFPGEKLTPAARMSVSRGSDADAVGASALKDVLVCSSDGMV
jgi:IS5 family transposase